MSDPTPFHERELDDRIRALVATAVADAPPAPDLLAEPELIGPTPSRTHRPWWIVGTSLVGAAAAAVALIIVTGPGEDSIAPVDSPPAVAPGPPSGPDTSAPTPTSSSQLDVAPTGAPEAALAVADGSIVVISDAAGNETARIEEPWSIALAVGDGRIVGQEKSGAGFGRWEAVDTTPRIWSPDGTVLELFPVVGERSIDLHDVAVIGDRPWLLYSVHNGDLTPDGQREELHAVSLDGQREVLDIGQISGWEGGTNRLHLAANGLIVGESYGEALSTLLVMALPGSPAEAWASTITPASLGLEDSYFDCAETCPTAYTVDDTGTRIAWLQGDEIVVTAFTDGVPGVPSRAPVPATAALVVDVDLLLPTSDLRYVLSYFQVEDRAPEPAQMVVSDSSAVVLPGLAATWGPAGSGTSAPTTTTGGTASPATEPPLVTPPTAVTTSPATAPPTTVTPVGLDQFLVTAAGVNGVVQETPATRRSAAIVGEPTEIAFGTSAGLLFQRQRGYVEERDAAATVPQLRDPSGATSVWSVAAGVDPGAWWSLHDVVEFQGEPWVIYSLQTTGRLIYADPSGDDVYEITDRLYAVPLAGGTPTDLGLIGGWESGTSRVQASPDGVLVASFSESVTTSYWTATLPGATASAPSADALGIAASSSECEACPRVFGWSTDGSAITWLEGNTVVIHSAATGSQARIDITPYQQEAARVIDVDVAVGTDGTTAIALAHATDWPRPPETSTLLIVDPTGAVSIVETPASSQLTLTMT